MIFVPNQLVGAPTGTNVTIDCHTEAYPRAMSYWFLGDEMILSNEKYTTSIILVARAAAGIDDRADNQ